MNLVKIAIDAMGGENAPFKNIEGINLFYQNIQKSFENSNDARWSNIPKVVDYKELSLYTKDELAYIGLDKIMRNHDNIEKQNVLREGKEVFRSEIIANNDLVTDNFYDQKSLKELEISNRANSVTYSNSISNEALNYEMELDNILKSNNNNLWIVGIDNYKQESSLLGNEVALVGVSLKTKTNSKKLSNRCKLLLPIPVWTKF